MTALKPPRAPKVSTVFFAGLAAGLAILLIAALLLGRAAEPGGRTVVTFRLWDEQVANAYRASFAEFGRDHPGIDVRVDVVAFKSYFDTLRTDVAGGGAADVFWLSSAYLAQYADSGRLLDVGAVAGPDAVKSWDRSVVDQFTRSGRLRAVPQLTDAGIALYFNADLLDAAGVGLASLLDVRWSPSGPDTLRPLAARLTVDVNGNRADTPAFDATRVRQWGYNAANDLQAISLDYVGSAGGRFQEGDRFAFANPASEQAFQYLVDLINTYHVAPPASETNDNDDFSRNQFLQGRMALFQSGTYNLAAVADQVPFRWGVTMLPAGPAGRVSVTNGIAAAGNAATRHPEAVRQVLAWLGSARGNAYLSADGSAIPAVTSAQPGYFDYWARRGVDVRPFFRVLDGPRIAAPGGAGYPAGAQALKPYFDEMFLGRRGVADGLAAAQAAANAAALDWAEPR